MDMKRVELRMGGMFSNVNEVVQRLHLANQGGFGFVIRWSGSFYQDKERSDDPWSYFFEPCFPEDGIDAASLDLWGDTRHITRGSDNTITPRAGWRDASMLMLPNNRHIAAGHINNHLTTKPAIQKTIDTFSQAHFTQPTIGLHIRGQGRADGGATELRTQLPCESGMPFGQYFDLVRKELRLTPAARIFIC
jgi:hypothetical protein